MGRQQYCSKSIGSTGTPPSILAICHLDYLLVMIEVFKTNVTDLEHANMLLDRIHKTFIDYRANFDLDDCDKILRVKSSTGDIQPSELIDLLRNLGFDAEVLPDESYLLPDHEVSGYTW